jgi:hypothetical protein
MRGVYAPRLSTKGSSVMNKFGGLILVLAFSAVVVGNGAVMVLLYPKQNNFENVDIATKECLCPPVAKDSNSDIWCDCVITECSYKCMGDSPHHCTPVGSTCREVGRQKETYRDLMKE